MSESWQTDLAMIRQRAAARCGLREYPAELIGAAETVARSESHLRQLEQRRAELEAELKWIR